MCQSACRYRTAVEEVPNGEYTVPLGKAKLKRQGSDITLVGWGQQVAVLEKAVSAACTPVLSTRLKQQALPWLTHAMTYITAGCFDHARAC